MDKQQIINEATEAVLKDLSHCGGLKQPDSFNLQFTSRLRHQLHRAVDRASGFKPDAVLLAEQDARHYGCSWIKVHADGSMTHYHAADVPAVDEKPADGGPVTSDEPHVMGETSPETVRPATINDHILTTMMDGIKTYSVNSDALSELAKRMETQRRAEIQDVAHDVLLAALQPGGVLYRVLNK